MDYVPPIIIPADQKRLKDVTPLGEEFSVRVAQGAVSEEDKIMAIYHVRLSDTLVKIGGETRMLCYYKSGEEVLPALASQDDFKKLFIVRNGTLPANDESIEVALTFTKAVEKGFDQPALVYDADDPATILPEHVLAAVDQFRKINAGRVAPLPSPFAP